MSRLFFLRAVLVIMASLIALIVGDCLLFLMVGIQPMVEGQVWEPFRNSADRFEPDQELGFKPIFDEISYDQNGIMITNGRSSTALTNSKRRRVLFIGDSVTHRRKLERALVKALDPAREVDCWNAGVESFNTAQEVGYFRRFNSELKPDHVVLTFHHNDFEVTPVAFRDPDGSFRVVAPKRPRGRNFNPWLYEHSFVYRQWFGLSQSEHTVDMGEHDVRRSLSELVELLQQTGAELTVLVLPSIEPIAHWSPHQKNLHERAVRIMRDLEIRFFDLLPALRFAERDGIELQEQPGDTWHPSAVLARYFALQLKVQGFRF